MDFLPYVSWISPESDGEKMETEIFSEVCVDSGNICEMVRRREISFLDIRNFRSYELHFFLLLGHECRLSVF